jgi:hypothetical protein
MNLRNYYSFKNYILLYGLVIFLKNDIWFLDILSNQILN